MSHSARLHRSCFFRCRDFGRGLEVLERRDMLNGDPTVIKVEVGSTAWSAAFIQHLNPPPENPLAPLARGYAIPLGSASQAASLTWKNIDQITITFSEDVHVHSADLSVSGVFVAVYEVASFYYDPQARAATWTLSGPINRDRIRLDLDGDSVNAVTDLEGNVLDGDWTNNVSVSSGDGVDGGDFEFNFNVLPADVNSTGSITSYDYIYIRLLEGTSILDVGYNAARDVDGSGAIDAADWLEALSRILQALPGGAAAGTFNDAPTTAGFNLIQIDDDSVDVAVTLLDRFWDFEGGSDGLAFSIVSNSSPELFDFATIDADTRQLVFNTASSAVGRATIVVRATDADGLFVDTTLTIDVNRDNLAPEIYDFAISHSGAGIFIVSGSIIDADDDVSDFLIYFWGVIETRSAVNENGQFEFAVEIPEGTYGIVYASTVDPHGEPSEVYWHPIELS